jgi:toxin HigB-1
MIKTFRDRDAAQVFRREFGHGIPAGIHRAAWQKLAILDAADRLADLMVPPGNRLEKLRGDRQSQYSIRINNQWRICFRWREGDAYDVEIVDYR